MSEQHTAVTIFLVSGQTLGMKMSAAQAGDWIKRYQRWLGRGFDQPDDRVALWIGDGDALSLVRLDQVAAIVTEAVVAETVS